jgi:formate hydrogenlyase transcriptional activator
VRELQNLVERAVILSDGGVLPNPLPQTATKSFMSVVASPRTLRENERALILEALRQADWVIGGPEGAAERLGLKRTTLIAKMKKLEVYRPVHSNNVNPLRVSRFPEAAACA